MNTTITATQPTPTMGEVILAMRQEKETTAIKERVEFITNNDASDTLLTVEVDGRAAGVIVYRYGDYHYFMRRPTVQDDGVIRFGLSDYSFCRTNTLENIKEQVSELYNTDYDDCDCLVN